MKGVCGGIPDKSPQSEQKVYEALKETFPKEWHAWHSMKLCCQDKKEVS